MGSKRWQYLFQLLHVQRLVQVQAGVLVFAGGRIDEPLQESLQEKQMGFFFRSDLIMNYYEVESEAKPETSPCRSRR